MGWWLRPLLEFSLVKLNNKECECNIFLNSLNDFFIPSSYYSQAGDAFLLIFNSDLPLLCEAE